MCVQCYHVLDYFGGGHVVGELIQNTWLVEKFSVLWHHVVHGPIKIGLVLEKFGVFK